ncbi:ABC transporter permease subunit [Candidatus Neomarinimicrobiota bacterium]
MIWRIVWKEVLSNIKTLRFSIGTVLFLSLLVIFTSILISDYRYKLQNFNEFVLNNDEELTQLMTYQNLKPTVYKPPEILALFNKGLVDNIRNSTQISIGDVPDFESASTSTNPLLSVFQIFDITLIFKIVISIFTLLLVYDSISGEKEDRTLALLLSNNLPRYKLLLGKFIGGMITITIPIAIGIILQGIILAVSPLISLSASDWLRIILIYFISLITVAVLFNLGLFISSVTRAASDTLILLLFVWVIIVLVIPNASTYLASQSQPVGSREDTDLQVQELWRQFNMEVNDYSENNISYDQESQYIQSDAGEPWGFYHKFATKNLIRIKQELNSFSEPLRVEYAEKVWQAERRYLENMEKQNNLSKMISRFSPISIYELLVSGLSRSDIAAYNRFYEQAREYRNQLVSYLNNKNAFSSIRYISTVKEEHLFDVKSGDEYGSIRNRYLDVIDNPQPLDTEDIPRFILRNESVSATIYRLLPDVALLCIMGILFFLFAFVALLKYDVR